jgi:hypothetical protein
MNSNCSFRSDGNVDTSTLYHVKLSSIQVVRLAFDPHQTHWLVKITNLKTASTRHRISIGKFQYPTKTPRYLPIPSHQVYCVLPNTAQKHFNPSKNPSLLMHLAHMSIPLCTAPITLIIAANIRPRIRRHDARAIIIAKLAEPGVCEAAL